MASTPVDLGASDSTPRPSRLSSSAGLTSARSTPVLAAATDSSTQQLSSHHDGRIRNPTPSKLKGKTDAKKGNFGVMLIDVGTRTASNERGAAAKRTSEITALRAKLAFQDGYVPLSQRKIRLDWLAPPVLSPPPAAAASTVAPAAPPEPRRTPLSPSETKAEQARLLTLLRSLHPVMVVDQVCKALAFFGGIPGAPSPPSDVGFPESHVANGAGSLFVGWLSEIFPPLGPIPSVLQKRPRGRPKGSKTTKFRRDKGPSKGNRSTGSRQAKQCPSSSTINTDDVWVDIDETALVDDDNVAGDSRGLSSAARPAVSSSFDTPLEGMSTLPTPRRRGRPKGSKNRPKQLITPVVASSSNQEHVTSTNVTPSGRQQVEPQTSATTKRAGPGRPKGSKNKPKPSNGNNEIPENRGSGRPDVLDHPPRFEDSVTLNGSASRDRHHPAQISPGRGNSMIICAAQPSSSVGLAGPKHASPKVLKRKRPGLPRNTEESTGPEIDIKAPEQAHRHLSTPTLPVLCSTQTSGSSQHINNDATRKRHKHSDMMQTQSRSKTLEVTPSAGQCLDSQHPTESNGGICEAETPTDHTLHNHGSYRDSSDIEAMSVQHNQARTPAMHAQPLVQSPVHALQRQQGKLLEQNAEKSDVSRSDQSKGHRTGRPTSTSHHDLRTQVETARPSQPLASAQQQQQQGQKQHSQHGKHLHQGPTSPVQISTPINFGNTHPTTNISTQDSGIFRVTSIINQSPFSRVAAPVPSLDTSYRNHHPLSGVQQQHPSIFPTHRHRQHPAHDQRPGMAAFHGYTDSSFLDLGSIDTSGTQTSIGIAGPSYGVARSHAQQRNLGSLPGSFVSHPGGGQHGFEDVELGDSVLRGRMYHPRTRPPE